MQELDISFGKHRADTNWKSEYLTWDEFVGRLRKVRRTNETMAEYDKMNNLDRGKIKDGPAFVGGMVLGGRRKKENVDTRSLITLDVDHGTDEFMLDADLILGGTAYVIYSTHSHRTHKPKYRLIVPADRKMSPDEYAAVSRKLAEQIGLAYFDKTTFDVHRLMYLPSCSRDAEPVLDVFDGSPLSVDRLLGCYTNWQDPLSWPRHDGDKVERVAAKRMEDPRIKRGVVGAFCRCYSISEAIAAFLIDVYQPTDDSCTRYTFAGATSYGGLVVYDEDTFAFSHHESDPCSGREVNAFDLVRLHKFGGLDEKASENTRIDRLPSYTAMLAWATQNANVKQLLLQEQMADYEAMTEQMEELADAEDDNDTWQDMLETHDKTGRILSTPENIEILLSHGEWKNVLAYDAFSNCEVIKAELPWRKKNRPDLPYEPWLAEDDKRLQHWFGKKYEIKGASTIINAFTEVTRRNRFHPIKQYLESLYWDGVPRVERLFIDYLGAADTHYVRSVTRKMLLAAVTRIYEPGCKFDQMLVLIGPQGAGKSSLLAKLGRKWFSDSLRTFENKEAGEHLQAGWIFEIGELAAMTNRNSTSEEVKAFLSKTEDRYRVAYDRQVSEFPRKCVFFGSTNTRQFLHDNTGNRRFWPVECHVTTPTRNHWKEFTDDEVGQLWAEVLTYYREGERLSLDDKARVEAERQQNDHMEEDPRIGIIQEWLDSPIEDYTGKECGEFRQTTCAMQIWIECLHGRKDMFTPYKAREVNAILRKLPGWAETPWATVPGYTRPRISFKRLATYKN
jgi:predicted P-loop ATPase